MDKLKAYLADHQVSVSDFADAIRVHVRTAYRYVDGDRFPSPPIMRRIVEWSGGAIQPNDFYSLPEHSNSPPTEARAGE